MTLDVRHSRTHSINWGPEGWGGREGGREELYLIEGDEKVGICLALAPSPSLASFRSSTSCGGSTHSQMISRDKSPPL